MTGPQRPGEITVRLQDVAFSRSNPEGATVQLLQDVSFSARSGEITTIIGPSGGGKSTLIRLINRLAEPTGGTVFLQEVDIRSLDPLQLRREVALVPQKPFMFDGTVLQNLQAPFLYRREAPPAADSEEVRTVMVLARLEPDLLERNARSLSIGQQQRVGVARALIAKPRVLLMDEPTSALDRRTSDALATTLREICQARNLTFIMVTHDLRLTERVADYCLYLEAGRILEGGATADLLSNPKSAELKRFLSEPSEQEA